MEIQDNKKTEENISLDSERRIKVLSPGMLVFKRFMRNKLAIVGMVILIVMFAFSFLGGLLSPYSQAQVFKTYEFTMQEFASAMYNAELRYSVAEGSEFGNSERSLMTLAITKGEGSFESKGTIYQIVAGGENFYRVMQSQPVMNFEVVKKYFTYKPIEGGLQLTDELKAAIETAYAAKLNEITYQGTDYMIVANSKKEYSLCIPNTIAVASMVVYDAYALEDESVVNNLDFRYRSESAILAGQNGFESNGVTYTVSKEDAETIIMKDGNPFAAVSGILVSPKAKDNFLPVNLKNAIRDAITNKQNQFKYVGESGAELSYEITRVNATYSIKGDVETELIDMYRMPSADHPLGTDGNGMDLLTRLMYGGRVSLMVGFVVVFIELFIGVIMGGISGYFGKWVDTLIMRFVDLFNCIPYYPMLIIIAFIFEAYKVEPNIRIYLLMVLLGVMNWTGIARVVRGQILSLREQDFMIAAEATGIRVSKRIFKHLVPNVMPLLIVQATMQLGGIIITEATLSFLGLGVKYPLASWGTIINAASNIYVMTNYWNIWLPAGLLILITVLGFNFVGDGLRDAFDPKMKR
jgi:peptide/nickel transport system permease protein